MTTAPNSTLSFLSAGSTTGTNVTGADLIKEHVTGAHWVGTAKMGTKGDDGVVVDTNTQVYGTDNLFVVDASIHADLPTGNTQAMVMVVAEHAVAKILALKGTAPSNGTEPSASAPSYSTATHASSAVASAPVASAPAASISGSGYATFNPAPSSSVVASAPASIPSSSAAPISTGVASAPAAAPTSGGGASSGTVQLYGQCGGQGYTGATKCAQGTCVKSNDWYSQCINA
jgi:cellobiose dehydrogenase (acceptor)